jgi:hypothetical protein
MEIKKKLFKILKFNCHANPMKRLYVYCIVAGIAAIVAVSVIIAYFYFSNLRPWPPDEKSGEPPNPYDILVNGKESDLAVYPNPKNADNNNITATKLPTTISIPQGQTRILDVTVVPKILGISGDIHLELGNTSTCTDSLGPNLVCKENGGLEASISQTKLPMSNSSLKPIPVNMTITVPSTAPPGLYTYNLVAETNYTWPNGSVTHVETGRLIVVEVVVGAVS